MANIRRGGVAAALAAVAAVSAGAEDAPGLIFGDDASEFANDGECDDPRFVGEGMASPPLLEEDKFHDAADCQRFFDAGQIRLRAEDDDAPVPPPPVADAPDGLLWGDDSSRWARDGECDDPRFEGPGAAAKKLDTDIGRDAEDCMNLFGAGEVRLTEAGLATPIPARRPAALIDFGDNESPWAGDAECDDPRFEGQGSAAKLDPADEGRDAVDCRAAYENGRIRLR